MHHSNTTGRSLAFEWPQHVPALPRTSSARRALSSPYKLAHLPRLTMSREHGNTGLNAFEGHIVLPNPTPKTSAMPTTLFEFSSPSFACIARRYDTIFFRVLVVSQSLRLSCLHVPLPLLRCIAARVGMVHRSFLVWIIPYSRMKSSERVVGTKAPVVYAFRSYR
jgi:hypothetical protein